MRRTLLLLIILFLLTQFLIIHLLCIIAQRLMFLPSVLPTQPLLFTPNLFTVQPLTTPFLTLLHLHLLSTMPPRLRKVLSDQGQAHRHLDFHQLRVHSEPHPLR